MYGRRKRYFKKTGRYRKASRYARRAFKRTKRRIGFRVFRSRLNRAAEKKTVLFPSININAAGVWARYYSTDSTDTMTGIYANINQNLTQGAGAGQRVGTQIFIKKIVIRGNFLSTVTNGFSGICGVWLFKETTPASMSAGLTRNQLFGQNMYSAIPDYYSLGYKPIKKKNGYCYAPPAAAGANTPVLDYTHGVMGPRMYWNIKLKVNKIFKFDAGTNWTLGNSKCDIYPCPFVDAYSIIYNTNNGGLVTQSYRVYYNDV